jgi:hypothetical protein
MVDEQLLDRQVVAQLQAAPAGQPVHGRDLAAELGVTMLLLVGSLERLRSAGILEVRGDGTVRLAPADTDTGGPASAEEAPPSAVHVGGAAPFEAVPPPIGSVPSSPTDTGRPVWETVGPKPEGEGMDALHRNLQDLNRILVSLLWIMGAVIAIGIGAPVLALIPVAYLVYLWGFGGRWLIY